jgi:anthraniloyl-CoA monooxygenase
VYDEPAPDGTGIVLDSEFVDELTGRDPRSGTAIARAARRWDTVRLCTDDTEIVTGGHVILGIGRRRLLDILRERAVELGAVVHRCRFDPAVPLAPGGLLIGADGAGSAVRGARADEHGPSIEIGATRYLWMWADAAFDPGFWFRRLRMGALVAHVYPYEERASAVIVECTPQALQAAGLDVPDPGRLEDRLTGIFAGELAGARLLCSVFPWRSFRTVANRRWHTGDQVLIGDAAHTTHFTVGSGTRLAVEDAMGLADALCADPRRESLAAYERERRPPAEAMQREGRSSQQWFEHIDRHIRLPGRQLAFALRTRREVNTYSWLKKRDPGFVDDVLTTVAADPRTAPSPTRCRFRPEWP